jgi:hypothetical protein
LARFTPDGRWERGWVVGDGSTVRGAVAAAGAAVAWVAAAPWRAFAGWVDSPALSGPSLVPLPDLGMAATGYGSATPQIGRAARPGRAEFVWMLDDREDGIIRTFPTSEGGVRGTRLAIGEDPRYPSSWRSPDGHLPTGRPTVAVSDAGFFAAWRAWGGDHGHRAVAASIGARGGLGPLVDAWRSTEVRADVLAVGRGSRRGVLFVEHESGDILFRRLDAAGVFEPEAFRVGSLRTGRDVVLTEAASDEHHVFVLQDDPGAFDRRTIACFAWDDPRPGLGVADGPPSDARAVLVEAADGVRVVAGDAGEPADGRLLSVSMVRCVPSGEPADARRDDHLPTIRSRILHRGRYRMARLAWNGSRLVVAVAGEDDVVRSAVVEPDGTFDGEWHEVAVCPRLPFSLTGLPDGRSLLAWATDDRVRYRVLGPEGRPSGDEASWEGASLGAPAVAVGAIGTAIAWIVPEDGCRPRVALLDEDLRPLDPVDLDDPVRCEHHPWPAALEAIADGFRVYWMHDTGPSFGGIVVRTVDWNGREIVGRAICQGEVAHDPVAGFGPPIRGGDDVVFIPQRPSPPRIPWYNPYGPMGYAEVPVFLQWGVVAVDLRERRVTEWPLDPSVRCRGCCGADSAVIAHGGRAVALFPTGSRDASYAGAFSVRILAFDGPEDPDRGWFGEAPCVESVDAVALGSTVAVLWSEGNRRDGWSTTLDWTLRLGWMTAARLP